MLLYYTAIIYKTSHPHADVTVLYSYYILEPHTPSQMLLYNTAIIYQNLIPPVRCYCTIQLLYTKISYAQSDVTVLYSYCLLEPHTPSQMLLYYTATVYQNLISLVRCYCTIQLLFTRTSYPQSDVTVLYSYCLLEPHAPSQMLLYYTATVYQNLIPPVRCYCTMQLLYTRTSYAQSDVTVLYSYCLLEPHTPSQMLLYYTATVYQNLIRPVRCYCTIQLLYTRTSYAQSDVTVLYSYCLLEPHIPSQMLLYYTATVYQNLIPQSDVTVLYSYCLLEPHTPSQMLLYYTAIIYTTSHPQSDVTVLYSYYILEPHTPSQMLLYYTAIIYQNLIPPVRCYCTIQLLYTKISYAQSDVTVLYSYCLLEPHTSSQMLLYYTATVYWNLIPPVRCYCTIQLLYTRTSYAQSDVTVLYSYCLLEPHTPSQMLLYYTATVYQNLMRPVRCYCTIQLLFTRTSCAQSDVTVLYSYCLLEPHIPSQMLLYYTATVYQNLIPPVRCYCTIQLLFTRTSYAQSDVTVLYSYCLLEPHTPVRCYCTIQLLYTRTSYAQSDVTVLYSYCLLEPHTPSQMLLYYTATVYQNLIRPVRCYCTIQLLFTRTSYPQSDVTVLYSYCLLEPHIPSQMLLYYTATVYQNLIPPVRCYCTIQLLHTRTSYPQSDVTVLYSYYILKSHSPVRCYSTIQLLFTRTSYPQSDVTVLYSYYILEPHTPSQMLLNYTATVYQNLIRPVRCYCTIQLLFTRTSYPSQMLLYYAATVYKNLIPPVRCYCTIQLLFTGTSYPSQMLLYYTAIIYQNLIRPVRCYCTIQLLFTRTSYPQSNVTVLYSYCLLDPHTPSQMLLYYTATVYQNLIPPVRCYCTIQL